MYHHSTVVSYRCSRSVWRLLLFLHFLFLWLWGILKFVSKAFRVHLSRIKRKFTAIIRLLRKQFSCNSTNQTLARHLYIYIFFYLVASLNNSVWSQTRSYARNTKRKKLRTRTHEVLTVLLPLPNLGRENGLRFSWRGLDILSSGSNWS